jgi:hypothetical protein
MSGGQRHPIDEVKTGRAIGLDTKSSTQDRYSLAGNQCVCADVKSVFEIMKKTTPTTLTRPTSLEMLLTGVSVEKSRFTTRFLFLLVSWLVASLFL